MRLMTAEMEFAEGLIGAGVIVDCREWLAPVKPG